MTGVKSLVAAVVVGTVGAAGVAIGAPQSLMAAAVWVGLGIVPLVVMFAFSHARQPSMSEIIQHARR